MKKLFLMLFLLAIHNIYGIAYSFGNNFNQIDQFMGTVIPELESIHKEYNGNIEFDSGEKPLDTLVYAYLKSLEIIKFRNEKCVHIGCWNEEIKKQVIVVLSILCPIKDLFHIRKTRDYQERMHNLRLLITQGAYIQTIKYLTFTPFKNHEAYIEIENNIDKEMEIRKDKEIEHQINKDDIFVLDEKFFEFFIDERGEEILKKMH